MAPRTAKAKKNADVKVSENEVPKKGRGKAKDILEPEQVSSEIVEEKVIVSEKKNKRKNAANENNEDETSAIFKEEKALPAKKGRKKNVEGPNSDLNALNGENSAEEELATPVDDQSEDQASESNGQSEDVQAPPTKSRKKPSKKESADVKPKESGRAKKNAKQETVNINKEEIEEKPKGRGRSRKAKPTNPEPDQEDDEEDIAKIEPSTTKGRKRGQQKATQEKLSDMKKNIEEKHAENENEESNEDIEEEKEVEPKKKGRKNAGKKVQAKEELEDYDEEIKEAATKKKRKDTKKEEKGKGDSKGDTEKDEDIAETKPKGKRGQKKTVDKPAETEEVQDTGEPTTKRRRKADEKATEDSKKKPAKSITDYQSIDFSNASINSQGKEWNLKIASWNVDGIRAWMGKEGLEYLKHEKPDILCLQEVKCSQEKLPEEVKNVPGYHAYWLCSDKDGYAGVGIYTTKLAMNVQYGLQNEELDSDGRIITAEYEQFYLICTYVPNAGRKLVTLPKRLKWNEEFRKYVKTLDKNKPVIICGDMNVAHNEIDLTNPKTNKKNAGFTNEERAGMTELLGEGFIDLYRHFYPDKTGAYTFWTYMFNSRAKNVGWRLDYFIVSQRLLPALCDTVIRDKVYGSDHCPITLFLHITSADKPKE